MTTAIAKIEPQQLTPDQQNAWLGMAQAKNNLVAELTTAELEAQGILNATPTTDYAAIDAALANYRKAHTNMIETRKTFTGLIDAGIIQPLMAFEKRVDPKTNQQYVELAAASLQLRKAEEAKAAQQNAINQELANFKAHCGNEFFRVAAQYRADVRAEIDRQYAYWLQQTVAPDVENIKNALAKVAIPPIAKFTPRYITVQQMEAAYNEVHKPDFQEIYQQMHKECDMVFANFDSDKANAAAAIAARQEQSQLASVTETRAAAEESAINTLIATAEAVTVETPTIKRTVQVVVVESEQWAKSVMAAFITNLPHLAKYIRVKSWAKLTIGQMAEYLGKLASETGNVANGLEYQEVEK